MDNEEIKPHLPKDKILIVGQGEIGKALSNRIDSLKHIVELPAKRPVVIVNGERYVLKPDPKKDLRGGKMMMMAHMLSVSLYSGYGNGGPKLKPLHEVSSWLVNEYELVLKKESNLSRAERERVIQSFNKHFRKVVE